MHRTVGIQRSHDFDLVPDFKVHEIKHDGYRLLARASFSTSSSTSRATWCSSTPPPRAAKASSRSARTRARLGKIKSPAAPAVKREAEEDWGKKRR